MLGLTFIQNGCRFCDGQSVQMRGFVIRCAERGRERRFLSVIYGCFGVKVGEFYREKFIKKTVDCENKERIIPHSLTENRFRENTSRK